MEAALWTRRDGAPTEICTSGGAYTALGVENYQLRDSRHSYAVRAIRAGASPEVVARQLGHVNTTMVVSVYRRFRPNDQERTDWERIAALQDAERATHEAS